VAGTPSTIAPENARGQPVDGRTDVYSLGAVAYIALTGRRPYPVASMSELEAAWRRPPLPPSRCTEHAIPRGLDELVMSMLAIDPLGRPASAAEVIDRLTAIAGLAPLDATEVRRGFLASAAIVGRTRELDRARAFLDAARHGAGGTLWIEAESGTGKSRLLGEIALEARLAGAVVLDAACDTAPPAPYGTFSRLVDRAVEAAPESAIRAARRHIGVLAQRFPRFGLRPSAMASGPMDPGEERLRVQASLVGWLRAWARPEASVAPTPLCIVVDDVQRADEASAAALAALANDLQDLPIALVVARRTGEAPRAPAAIGSMARRAEVLSLTGLSIADVEALARSFFGDVPNVGRLAQLLHARTGGSPLHTTELLRTLVEGDVVRYVDGAWTIPSETSALATGRYATLSSSLDVRVQRLGGAALEVARALAIAGGRRTVATLVAILARSGETLDEQAAFAAVDALALEGIVIADALGARFLHDGLREATLRTLADARRTALELATGEVLLATLDAEPGREAEVGWHLVRGGATERGAELLARAGRRLFDSQALSDCIAPLEKALEVRAASGAPAAELMELRAMLLQAGWVSDRAVGSRHALAAVEGYMRHTGLDLAHRLAGALGPVLATVIGLGWGAVRWALRVEWLFGRGARGPGPIRASSTLAVCHAFACGLANAENRADDLIALVEMVAPFRAFRGRMAEGVHAFVASMPDILFGRLQRASERLALVIRVFAADALAPVSEVERRFAITAARGLRVLVDVNQFDPRLEEDLAALDASGFRYYALVAQATRAVRHRYRGEEEAARAVERAMEPEAIALGSWSTDVQILYFAHPAYALTSDIEGLKRSLDALERLVAQGFRVEDRAACARGDLLRARGEAEAARALLVETVRGLAPRNLLMRQWIGSSLADASLACGMHAEARAEAEAVLAVGDAEPDAALLLPRLRAERIRALAMAALGDTREAVFALERVIAQAEARGVTSLAGLAHEARARIALAADDRVAYLHHAAECERHFRASGNASLLAAHDRLVSAGTRARGPAAGPEAADDTIASGPHDTVAGPDADTRLLSSRRHPSDNAP
jgi:hypothetical protein